MTATVFVPTGNPVRRFVLALAAIGVAASAVWLSGLAAPRLAVVSAEPAAGWQGTLVVRLRNDGPLPVEMRTIRFPDKRLGAGVVRPAGVELSGGEVATFEVDYTLDCGAGVGPASARMIVTVATPLGLHRTRNVGDSGLPGAACPSQ